MPHIILWIQLCWFKWVAGKSSGNIPLQRLFFVGCIHGSSIRKL